MSALIRPIPHTDIDDSCYACWFTGKPCSDVCAGCGCQWTIDLFDEPNRQDEACEGACDCHSWTLVESRAAVRNDDGLEAAWRDAGYRESYQVYLAEGR